MIPATLAREAASDQAAKSPLNGQNFVQLGASRTGCGGGPLTGEGRAGSCADRGVFHARQRAHPPQHLAHEAGPIGMAAVGLPRPWIGRRWQLGPGCDHAA